MSATRGCGCCATDRLSGEVLLARSLLSATSTDLAMLLREVVAAGKLGRKTGEGFRTY